MFEPPTYPSLDPHGRPLKYVPLKTFLHPQQPPVNLSDHGSGFEFLRRMRICDDYVDAFRDLADYNDTVYTYNEGILHIPGVTVAYSRNTMQHRLISLPPAKDLYDSWGASPSDGPVLPGGLIAYEACRLAALTYSVMVTFPLPRSRYARDRALTALREALGGIDPTCQDPDAARLYLWCLTVASIGALDPEQRDWFMWQTNRLAVALHVQLWEDAEDIFFTFVWLEGACSPAGRALWAQFWQW